MRTWVITVRVLEDDEVLAVGTTKEHDEALRLAPVPTKIIAEDAVTLFRNVLREVERGGAG